MARPTTIPWDQCSEERRANLRKVWESGDLSYKLHAHQKLCKAKFLSTPKARLFTLDSGRRWGKTFLGLILDLEACLQREKARVPVAAPEQKMVVEIILPMLNEIKSDCPPDLEPRYIKSEKAWVFPTTESRLVIAGTDINPDALRGTHLDFAHIIEAAFMSELRYVMQEVLIPQMQMRKHARMFMESTPPKSPLHPWSMKYVPDGKRSGAYFFATIEDNPMLDDEEREEFIELQGGRDSVECRREYFAEHIVEEDLAIVPEFRKVKDDVVVEHERPRYFDAYVSMDPGQVDLWAVLYGYFDFTESKLIVEDETVVNRETTSFLAQAIDETERRLWTDRNRPEGHPIKKATHEPLMRVSDTELQVIYDLEHEHGLTFTPTAKDDKLAALNVLRIWIQNKRILIHPRCVHLISHLEYGVWNERRTSYARVDGQGHFDTIDALLYMVRNVNERRNPYPPLEGISYETHFIGPDVAKVSKTKQSLANMFGGVLRNRGKDNG